MVKNNSIYQNEKSVEWAGFLNEFLWICAGVNRKILRQCPTDYAKYAGIGGTILFTALMAMLSGGYAMSTIFTDENKEPIIPVAILFGVFWGLLIFNLDRFIVNTMYSDGKHTISKDEFIAGLPRIIIAIFLGVVISMPLELKIFEDEIKIKIEENIKERIKEYQASDNQEIAVLQTRIDSLRIQIKQIQESPNDIYTDNILTGNAELNQLLKERQEKRVEYDKERQIIQDLSTRRHNLRKPTTIDNQSIHDEYNQKYRELTDNIYIHAQKRDGINRQISELNSQISLQDNDLKKILDKAVAEKEKQIASLEKEIEILNEDIKRIKIRINEDGYGKLIKQEYGGFQAKMNAFSDMKEENSSTYISSLFIMLLFIIIETSPTFFKMMIASGPYDDLLRAEMYRVRALSDKRIKEINDHIENEINISTAKNNARLTAEIGANKAVLEKLSTAQSQLIQEAIEEWKKQELEKVRNNPNVYINSNT
jgi:hypothetical protein